MKEKKSGGKATCCYTKKIKCVLILVAAFVILRGLSLAIVPAGYKIVGNAATTESTCPTRDNIEGDDSYTAGPQKTQALALASARALLKGRADLEAGLAEMKYNCPNPACQKKTLGNVIAVPDAGYPVASQTSLLAILATIFDLGTSTYWTAEMKYVWRSNITCRN